MPTTYDIICEEPGHAGRSAEPGWAASLGTSSVAGVTGFRCQACSTARDNDVVLVRATLAAEAKAAVSQHVDANFSTGAQSSLLALYAEASVTGKANRLAYIQGALDWIQAVLTAYTGYREALETAATAGDVRALVLTLPAGAPAVTVTGAMIITD